MKRLFAVLFIAFTAIAATAQNQGQTYMFTGKLVSAPTTYADCGTLANASVFEFEVTMLSDESYTEVNIPIVIKCPELLGQNFFKIGTSYKMELFDNMGDVQYGIANPDVLANYALTHNYWAGDIKRLH